MSSPAETFNSGLASYCGRSRESDASGTRTIDEQILRQGHFALCAPKSTRGQAIFYRAWTRRASLRALFDEFGQFLSEGNFFKSIGKAGGIWPKMLV
jgi:hypothetical protein